MDEQDQKISLGPEKDLDPLRREPDEILRPTTYITNSIVIQMHISDTAAFILGSVLFAAVIIVLAAFIPAEQWEKIAIFGFGGAILITILVIAIRFPHPTSFQYTIFRIVLAVAAAGVAALIPGFIEVTVSNYVRAGGALGVFAVVYFFSPAALRRLEQDN